MLNAAIILTIGMTISATLIVAGMGWQRFRAEYSRRPLTGAEGRVIEWDGRKGRVMVHEQIWDAYSTDTLPLRAGHRILVGKMEGSVLKINPIEHDFD